MTTIRRSQERGHADHGWLQTHHTFSFADYHDPAHMGFRTLRVINDDVIAGGGGFGLHPHRDMEIVTYVIAGALEHQDTLGNRAVMRAGDVQRISAGAGISHAEYNHSATEPVRLLQIWIRPDQKGVKPRYDEKSYATAAPGRLHLVTSKAGRDGSVPIHQDTDLWLARFTGGERITHALASGRAAWLQVAAGSVTLNGQTLHEGDGAAVSDEPSLTLTANGPAQVLLFDLQ
jgi:quercetin 2,3-dioxygenase